MVASYYWTEKHKRHGTADKVRTSRHAMLQCCIVMYVSYGILSRHVLCRYRMLIAKLIKKTDYGCGTGENVYLCVMAHKVMRTMMTPLTVLGKGILGFVVPDTCYVCGCPLRGDERAICAHCLIDLPRTMLHYVKDDAVLNGLATQVPVGRSAA